MMRLHEVVAKGVDALKVSGPVSLSLSDVIAKARQRPFLHRLRLEDLFIQGVALPRFVIGFGHVVAPVGCVRTPTVAGDGMAAYSHDREQREGRWA